MTAVGIAAFVIIMLISMFFDNFLMVIPGVITMVFLLIISRFMGTPAPKKVPTLMLSARRSSVG